MTEADFQALAKQGYTRVPVVLEARADLYTPLAVYLKLASGPFTYLLESVVGGERFGRYSFIGLACAERIEARGGVVRRLLREARGKDVCIETRRHRGGARRSLRVRARLPRAPARRAGARGAALRRRAGRLFRLRDGAPRRAHGAAPSTREGDKPDAIGTPDMLLLVSDELAVVDNVLGKLYLVVYADPREPGAWRAAHERLKHLHARLAAPIAGRIFR